MDGIKKRNRSASSPVSKSKRLRSKTDIEVEAVIHVGTDKLQISPDNPRRDELSNHADSSDDEFGNVSEYEKRRLKNLKDNAEFFANLGIYEAKKHLQAIEGTKKPARKITFKQKKPKEPPAPRRVSLRIQRIDPEGHRLPEQPQTPVYPVDEHPRKPAGPLVVKDTLLNDDVEESGLNKFVSSLQLLNKEKKTSYVNKFTSPESYAKSISSMCLSEDRVAKVVRNRIFSLAVHPSQTKTLVCAGDKWGQIGFWDIDSKANENILVFEPHSRPVNCLTYKPDNVCKLLSSSYDGTVRCLDMQKTVFDDVYASPEDDYLRATHFDFLSFDSIIVSQDDGTIAIVDLRTNSSSAEATYQLHNRVIKTVSVHPVNTQYFLTACNDGNMSIWDVRNMSKKNSKNTENIPSSRSVNSAYFSPVTGKYILSATQEDRIRIHFCENMNDVTQRVSFRHDNHVGRWLTSFRPVWHPQREDIFVSGSMNRPRQIEMYSDLGHMVKAFRHENLSSVCSINAFHPTRNILVGANSSGRLHVFM